MHSPNYLRWCSVVCSLARVEGSYLFFFVQCGKRKLKKHVPTV